MSLIAKVLPEQVKAAIRPTYRRLVSGVSQEASSDLIINRFAKFEFAYRKGTTDEIILGNIESYRLPNLVPGYAARRDDVIVNIGAHVGVFALVASRSAPDGKVFAVEASNETFNYLRINTALNRAENIVALVDGRGHGGAAHSSVSSGSSSAGSASALGYARARYDARSGPAGLFLMPLAPRPANNRRCSLESRINMSESMSRPSTSARCNSSHCICTAAACWTRLRSASVNSSPSPAEYASTKSRNLRAATVRPSARGSGTPPVLVRRGLRLAVACSMGFLTQRERVKTEFWGAVFRPPESSGSVAGGRCLVRAVETQSGWFWFLKRSVAAGGPIKHLDSSGGHQDRAKQMWRTPRAHLPG